MKRTSIERQKMPKGTPPLPPPKKKGKGKGKGKRTTRLMINGRKSESDGNEENDKGRNG
jgi:hypothetical protein